MGGTINENNIIGVCWTRITCPRTLQIHVCSSYNDCNTTDSGETDSTSWAKGWRSLYGRISWSGFYVLYFYVPPGKTGVTLCFWVFCPSFRPSHFTGTTYVQRTKAMTFQQIIMHVWQCPHDVDVHLLICFDLDRCTQSDTPQWRLLKKAVTWIGTNNDQMTSWVLGKWFWAMLEPILTLPTYSQPAHLHGSAPCFDLDLYLTCFPGSCLTRIFLIDLHWGVPLCVHHRKHYAFSTNYHVCIAIPTWYRCALPILFWPWSPLNLFLFHSHFNSLLISAKHQMYCQVI